MLIVSTDVAAPNPNDAVSAFWERHMATTKIEIETHRSFEAGLESAHLMTLTTSFENGVTTRVSGIFTYRVNDAGQLLALRGYWSIGDMEVLRAEPTSGASPA